MNFSCGLKLQLLLFNGSKGVANEVDRLFVRIVLRVICSICSAGLDHGRIGWTGVQILLLDGQVIASELYEEWRVVANEGSGVRGFGMKGNQ
jgi:hypothetical protein